MLKFLILISCSLGAFGLPKIDKKFIDDLKVDTTHVHRGIPRTAPSQINELENTAAYWNNKALHTIKEQLQKKPNTGIAKNVIMFLGDGMSIPTLAAARVYLSQMYGNGSGEENQLSFEKFPSVGLSKTYCVDKQVPDSACTATAYLCGVKANYYTAGVTGAVKWKDCEAMMNTTNHVHSVGRRSQMKGKRTGVVTTTRITHASPSGVYAHTAHREWEADSHVLKDGLDPTVCHDIAHQLIDGTTGRRLNVIFGGGRKYFIPHTQVDEDGNPGLRSDGRDLIKQWQKEKSESLSKISYEYVHNRDQLLNVPNDTNYVLGLFAGDHIDYNLDRNEQQQPSLKEMTVKAIELLSQGENGYFLFVEGGRIDLAHHESKAKKALEETVEFHKAIQAAADITNANDTLIVVTADHSHTMSVSGYPERGNDILGLAGVADDDIPYATLSYANGPGYKPDKDGKRHDVSQDDLTDKDYRSLGIAPLADETHGGDDVGIYARGPWAHLLNGVIEQNVIAHVMAFASCVNDDDNACTYNVK